MRRIRGHGAMIAPVPVWRPGDDAPVPMRSTLARTATEPPTTAEQLDRWRQEAWQGQRTVIFTEADLATMPDWLRLAIVDQANRLYGVSAAAGAQTMIPKGAR